MKDNQIRSKKYAQISDKFLCDVLSKRCNQFISTYKTTKNKSNIFGSQSKQYISSGTSNMNIFSNTNIDLGSNINIDINPNLNIDLNKIANSSTITNICKSTTTIKETKQKKTVITKNKIKVCTSLKYCGHNNFQLYSMERKISESFIHRSNLFQKIQCIQQLKNNQKYFDDDQKIQYEDKDRDTQTKSSKQLQLIQLLYQHTTQQLKSHLQIKALQKLVFIHKKKQQAILQIQSTQSKTKQQKVESNLQNEIQNQTTSIYKNKTMMYQIIQLLQQEYKLINKQLERVHIYTRKRQMKDVFNFDTTVIYPQSFIRFVFTSFPFLKEYFQKFDMDMFTNKQIQKIKEEQQEGQYKFIYYLIDTQAIIKKRKKQRNRRKNMKKKMKKNNKLVSQTYSEQDDQETGDAQLGQDNLVIEQKTKSLQNQMYMNQWKQYQNKQLEQNKAIQTNKLNESSKQNQKKKSKKQKNKQELKQKLQVKCQLKQNIMEQKKCQQNLRQNFKQTLEYLSSLKITNQRINCNISDDWIRKLKLRFVC